MKKAGIYCIKNKINGKTYIGSSRDLLRRKSSHFCKLRDQEHRNPYLQKSYNKYGKDSFEFSILEILPNDISEKDFMLKEDFYIDKFNSMAHFNGYNILKANRNIITKKQHEKLVYLNKLSQKSCNKKVFQYNLDGTFIQEHESVNSASKFLFPNLTEHEITYSRKGTSISKCCLNKAKSAFGYLWSFIKQEALPPLIIKYKFEILQFDLIGNLIEIHKNIKKASEKTGITTGCIYNSIKRNQIASKKYTFKEKEK